MAESYVQLSVWQRSIDLVDSYYDATARFPKNELFGMTSQMRRAAVSVPSNIAEGQARHSRKDLIRFLRHSKGSLAELRTQTVIAERRQYLTHDVSVQLDRQSREIDRMLSGLISSLTEKIDEAEEGKKKPALFSPETCAGFVKAPDGGAGELRLVRAGPASLAP